MLECLFREVSVVVLDCLENLEDLVRRSAEAFDRAVCKCQIKLLAHLALPIQ